MKRYLLFLLIVLMFCSVVSAGCGGGSDSPDSEQSENVSGETGEETGDYDPNDGGRGASGSISVHIDTCSAYKANYLTFYGLKSDGTWEEIAHYSRRLYGKDTTGNKDFTASKSYSAFGFEFDIDSGTDWPYSGVFWKEGDSSGISLSNMNSIYIDLAGTTFNAKIEIKINNKRVFYDGNCSSHIRFGWDYIYLTINNATMYLYKSSAFYGRKSSSEPWVKLIDKIRTSDMEAHSDVLSYRDNNNGKLSTILDKDDFLIPRSYKEFGFEFDIQLGTNWPYSDVFWKESDSNREGVNTIYIDVGGTVRAASIEIKVNDRRIFYDSNCDAHVPHYFKTENKIRVKTYKTTSYGLDAQRVYARKSSTSKWDIVIDETDGDHEELIDDDYIEFGFEFDIDWGSDWPYSRPFWTASDFAREKVEDIYIDMEGLSFNSNLYIYVNGKNIYSNTNLSSGSQYIWKRWDGTRIRTYKTTNYRLKAQRVYASNPGQGWTCVLDETNGDHTTYVSGYTEFGFEFDIEWGTDWPFSRPFWYGRAPDDIYIEMTGEVRTANLKIQVDGNTIYDNTNLSSGSRYSW